MSFWVSKLKDCFYSVQSKLSQTFSLFTAHATKQTGVLVKVQFALAVLAVFLPCFIYATSISTGDIGQEGFKGRQVPMNVSGVQDVTEVATANFVTRENGVPLQVNDFRKEGISKLSGSIVEIFNLSGFPVPALGQEMVGEADNNSAYNCAKRKTSWFNWHDFFLGLGGDPFLSVFNGYEKVSISFHITLP